MKKETNYKTGDIVEIKDIGVTEWRKLQIVKVLKDSYEWRYYPKQSENYYHTDYAGEQLLYKDVSRLIKKEA